MPKVIIRVFERWKKKAEESEKDVMTEREIRMVRLLAVEMDEGATGQGVQAASRSWKD